MCKSIFWFPIVLAVLWINVAPATIINVPSDSSTIQKAINGAIDGDTVRVAPGTYYDNINFSGKNIVVGSWFLDSSDTTYISTTIIDGSQATYVVIIMNGEDSTAVITGFTIQNGHTGLGGGIYCGSASPTISHNTISGNSADDDGGGIYCRYSSSTISHNTISGNSAYDDGGGIYCYYSSPTISHNIISGNSAGGSGGGGFFYMSSSSTISHNTISANSAFTGGAIYCDNSSPAIGHNIISGNLADDDGGGIFCYFSSPAISYNTISGNLANDDGGGIACHNSQYPTVSYNTISGNLATDGGGIACLYSSLIIINTILWDNSSAFGLEWSGAAITYCDVQDTLWPGTGNISCDPMFCGPDTGNFYLADSSCCVGAGQGGDDIGALGVGCGLSTIPTLSEWGLLIMALLLLATGTVGIVRRRRIVLRTNRGEEK